MTSGGLAMLFAQRGQVHATMFVAAHQSAKTKVGHDDTTCIWRVRNASLHNTCDLKVNDQTHAPNKRISMQRECHVFQLRFR